MNTQPQARTLLTALREDQLGWLTAFLAASFGAAGLGSVATRRSIRVWYRTLRKPRANPPNWVFAPVWTALYTLMAISAWLVRREMQSDPARARAGLAALWLWMIQLALNLAWSMVFFGRRSIGGGLGVIVPLCAAIAGTAACAARVAPSAGALLLPYLGWTGFACFLNFRVWQMNRRRPFRRLR
jgi:tryptophan-rich sensory protein